MGLDSDEPGIGKLIAQTAGDYGVDILNTLFLTPLPGTRLWDQMNQQGRIAAGDFPNDWRYYTLGFPTAHYKNFSWAAIVEEMNCCDREFYSLWGILRRLADGLLHGQHMPLSLVSNLSYRNNARLGQRSYAELDLLRGNRSRVDSPPSAWHVSSPALALSKARASLPM
jgi:hypothetical protein